MRLAVALAPPTEAAFVAIAEAARSCQQNDGGIELIVPALDREATQRRVEELIGGDSPVWVEPVADYIARGHDRAALFSDDPKILGRETADAIAWLAGRAGARKQENYVSPSQAVARLAQLSRSVRPSGESPRPGAVPVDDGLLLTTTAWDSPMLVLAADRSLTPDIVLHGLYDPRFIRFLEKSLGAGDTAADIGANVGLFAVRMAQLVGPTGRVLACEADPEIFEVLRQNIEMNYLAGWTELRQVAVYSTSAKLAFHRAERFRGEGSVVEGGRRIGSPVDVEVNAEPIDNLVRTEDRFDFIKVDVEGAERHVLMGMSDLIGSGRVARVSIEFVRETLRSEWEPLCELLSSFRRDFGATFGILDVDGNVCLRSLESIVQVGRYAHLIVQFPETG